MAKKTINQEMKIKTRKISDLIRAEYNPRELTKEQQNQLTDSLKRFGLVDPIIVNAHKDRKNILVGGHQRMKVWESMGNKTIPTVEVNLNLEKEKELNVRLNKNTGQFDMELLQEHFDTTELVEWGFNDLDFMDVEIEEFNQDEAAVKEIHNKLSDKFIIPPFSVLDTRQGHWQDRKRYWKELIGDNGESREGTLSEAELMTGINNGVSLLDPVMAEISNLWFGIENGKTFDCFAGDSVFGYVSDSLGSTFTGIELRPEQTELNNKRLIGSKSKYICDDGQNVLKHIKPNSQDLLFSCPPYYDLEVYSDMETDASNQETYEDFIKIIKKAFNDSIKCLKDNRFAVVVVGDIRDKNGFYYGFPDDIKRIFNEAGVKLYNEMIIVETLGTLPQRVGRYMNNRKIGKCHQNMLVFYKGDTKEIKNKFPKIEIVDFEEETLITPKAIEKKKVEIIKNKIRVSWKWASKEVGCTVDIILGEKGCGGQCCKTPSYYPPKSNGGKCFHLGDKGCKLQADDKPIKCLLYPFVIKNNLLVLHGRSLIGTCKPCYKKGGKMIIEHLADNFVTLFGERQYKRILNDVKNKRDSYIDLTDEFLEQLRNEDKLEIDNTIPPLRKGFGKII